MNKIYSFILVGVLALALVTAVLTPYLSNETSIGVDVHSPITIEDKTNSDSYFGGETIHYKGTATNNIDRAINGYYTLKVLTLGVSCEDLESVTITSGTEDKAFNFYPSETSLTPMCIELGPGVIAFQQEVHYEPLQTKVHLAELTLKLNVEPLPYEVKGSVMNMSLV
jgi:hypothetical protein